MRRREFISVFGSTVFCMAARGARTQQSGMKRIGVLIGLAADDPDAKARLAAFQNELERLGWLDGRNVHIDYRYGEGRIDQYQQLAQGLITLHPDVNNADRSRISAGNAHGPNRLH